MLDWLYENLGYWPTMFFLLSVFVMIIFWLAGIAGIMLLPPSKGKTIKLVLGVVIPPFTVAWMIYDMIEQRRVLKEP